MSKFVTKNIEAIKGKQQFKQLIKLQVEVDSAKIQTQINQQEENNRLIDEKKITGDKIELIKGELDLYGESLEAKDTSSFNGMMVYMNLVANLQSVPQKKFKFITPQNEKIGEFEFKYKNLRVYGIDIPNGKLIMYCGYKNSQPQDISKFRSLKKRYLASSEPQKIEDEKRRIDKK